MHCTHLANACSVLQFALHVVFPYAQTIDCNMAQAILVPTQSARTYCMSSAGGKSLFSTHTAVQFLSAAAVASASIPSTCLPMLDALVRFLPSLQVVRRSCLASLPQSSRQLPAVLRAFFVLIIPVLSFFLCMACLSAQVLTVLAGGASVVPGRLSYPAACSVIALLVLFASASFSTLVPLSSFLFAHVLALPAGGASVMSGQLTTEQRDTILLHEF